MTDKEFAKCMSAIQKGDRLGLKQIYEAYLKLIYAVIWDVVRSREEAEDITSEFFIKLFSLGDTYRPGGGHKAWLVTIARNMAIDRVRKIDREILVDELAEPITENLRQKSMETRVVEQVTLKKAMESLKADEKEILDLKVVGGFTFKEISEMYGKPIGTVSWIYNNAIKKLRRCRL